MPAIAVRSKQSLFALAVLTWMVWFCLVLAVLGPTPVLGQHSSAEGASHPPAGSTLPSFPLGTAQTQSSLHSATGAPLPLPLPVTAHAASPVTVAHFATTAAGNPRPQNVLLAAHSDDSPLPMSDDVPLPISMAIPRKTSSNGSLKPPCGCRKKPILQSAKLS